MDPLILIVGLAVGAFVLLRGAAAPAATGASVPPPPPPLPTMPWANAWTGGASVGITGPDASAYVPTAGVTNGGPPAGKGSAAGVLLSGQPTGLVAALNAAHAAMGGASWSPPAVTQPIPGTALSPPPGAVTTPTTEARSGRGHF
jgi:hypothetical protein